MEETRHFNKISNFVLKLIAIITMTFDHVGWALSEYVGENFVLVPIFRIIGRIALPLFCFTIAEGMTHTKNTKRYILRLGIMATVIFATILFVEYVPIFNGFSLRSEGNIFIDLLLGALTILLLKQKNNYVKCLAVLPFSLSVLSLVVKTYEMGNSAIVHWYPFFLRGQYDIYAELMIVGFYLAHPLCDYFLKENEKKTGLLAENIKGTFLEQKYLNIIYCCVVILATVALFGVSLAIPGTYLTWNPMIQNVAIVGGFILLFYNGRRGYNAKWFQYGCYLYYPLHLLIIFGIAMLIG